MFNEKLAKAMLKQRPTHRPQLDAFDIEAETQADAMGRDWKPLLKGKRLLNRTPHRSSLRV
jgi:hypothetical protein